MDWEHNMGFSILNSVGYENVDNLASLGVIGAKNPRLKMILTLDISTPPPPLVLFINPSSMGISATKKITPQRIRSNPLNRGYSIQHAFDELDTMSVSGMTAMMYHPQFGLTTKHSRSTASYDQWAKILALFRNNGVNYNSKEDLVIDSVSGVSIYYDGVTYKGSFDELTWKYSDELPYNFEFTWLFTISETIDSNIY